MEVANILTLSVTSITILNILLLIGVLFFERRDIGSTWVLVLVFLPIVGFFIYLILGRSLKQNNFYNLTDRERESIESEVEKQLSKKNSEKIQQTPLLMKHAELIHMNLKSSAAILSCDNNLTLFDDGHKKFDALVADIKAAKKEVNIQYYIIQPDALGKRIRDALIERAQAGVKIRLLYDDIGSKKTPSKFYDELRRAGGEVEVFFPSLIRPVNSRVNNRNHRKLVIIDGKTA